MRKPQIKVPFRFKVFTNSYRWGFKDAAAGRKRRVGLIGMAGEAYAAGYDAAQEKRERRTTLSLAGAATSAPSQSAALSSTEEQP